MKKFLMLALAITITCAFSACFFIVGDINNNGNSSSKQESSMQTSSEKDSSQKDSSEKDSSAKNSSTQGDGWTDFY